MPASPENERARPVDAIADAFVDESVQRYPETATFLGIPGHDDAWSDYSPDGFADQTAHLRRTIAALHSAAPSDEREHIAKEAMLERLSLEVELYEAHITTSRVSVIGGQAQEIRAIFDLMPTEGEDAWRNITTRLRTVETPLQQVRQTLAAEARDGNISAVRQVRATIEQIRSWTGQIGGDDFFSGLVATAPRLRDSLHSDLAYAAGQAREAFSEFADWLGETLGPLAPSLDAVGEERYALDSRYFLGRGDRSRGDLPVGFRGAAPDPDRSTRDRPRPGRLTRHQGGVRGPGRRSCSPALGGRGVPALDAGTGRPGRRRSGRHPLRHPGADQDASSAASHRPTTARSTTPIRPRTSPGPGRCGGPCPRRSTPSPPGRR